MTNLQFMDLDDIRDFLSSEEDPDRVVGVSIVLIREVLLMQRQIEKLAEDNERLTRALGVTQKALDDATSN